MSRKTIKNALISVFYKDNLEPIIDLLNQHGVGIYSTGGTQKFIEERGVQVHAVEDLTSYPSILGGRVKTLHPKVFGGILGRRELSDDLETLEKYEIPEFDLVIVDLYPFEETVKSGAPEADIIEKIDIGGISLIRAAAKNFKDVFIISGREQYQEALEALSGEGCSSTIEQRKHFAGKAFAKSSQYDTAISGYFANSDPKDSEGFSVNLSQGKSLRYGENPHQAGKFYGNLDELFEQLNGKELSYNNLVDVDAAVALIDEFQDTDQPAFAILKHTNACGVALGSTTMEAYKRALECDPVSAFGGVIITNKTIDLPTAEELNKLFFEVLITPGYDPHALDLLKSKKNRILLKRKDIEFSDNQFKSVLNGVLEMDKDLKTESQDDLDIVTERKLTDDEKQALLFANKIVKHTKSNAIVLSTKDQLIASGVGQTSRVDALQQAIKKAKSFNFSLNDSVLASDAFFPFDDCVKIANEEGIKAIVQPGGSIRDEDSIKACNEFGMSMAFTGVRHFKH